MFVISGDDTSFFEILKCSAIASFLHEKKLFSIPSIKIDRFDKRVDNTILTMFASTIQA